MAIVSVFLVYVDVGSNVLYYYLDITYLFIIKKNKNNKYINRNLKEIGWNNIVSERKYCEFIQCLLSLFLSFFYLVIFDDELIKIWDE